MVEENKNKPRVLSTSFLYTLPCKIDIWIYFTARDVSSTFLVDPAFIAYEKDKVKNSEPMTLLYDKEVFEDIEDKAHALIYEGEWEHVEDQRSNGNSERDRGACGIPSEGCGSGWQED